jgi:hypothetical protein
MKTRKKKKKENPLLKGVKIAFMPFDENGKINLLDDLKDINWIEYDKDKKM